MYVFDSSIWFDYFQAKPWCKAIRPTMASNDPILLSAVNLVEILSLYRLRAPPQADEIKDVLLNRCRLVEVTKEVALLASELKARHALALADAVVLATARLNDAVVWTYDSDFEGLKGARVLKRR